MWNKLTIQQAQEIDKLRRNVSKEDTEIDIETRLLSIILNKQQSEIDSLGWQEYLDQRAALKFLEQEPEGSPIQYVTIGKRKYRFVYDIRQMPFARYIESKTFAQDFIGNLHKLAASMVIPQRKTWYGKWKDAKYDAAKHIEYATDMLQAPFEAVYGSAVFLSSIQELDNSFKGLYDSRTSEDGKESGRSRKAGERFSKIYGWHWTSEEIKNYLGIPLSDVFELPTIEAVNAMSYLKGKSKYLAELQKNA